MTGTLRGSSSPSWQRSSLILSTVLKYVIPCHGMNKARSPVHARVGRRPVVIVGWFIGLPLGLVLSGHRHLRGRIPRSGLLERLDGHPPRPQGLRLDDRHQADRCAEAPP